MSPETSVAKYPSTLRNIAIVKALFNGCLFNVDLTTSSYRVECLHVLILSCDIPLCLVQYDGAGIESNTTSKLVEYLLRQHVPALALGHHKLACLSTMNLMGHGRTWS